MESGCAHAHAAVREAHRGGGSFHSDRLLTESGLYSAEIERDGGRWKAFHFIGEPLDDDYLEDAEPYAVTTLPVEFHCHGLGHRDFSEEHFLDLVWLNNQLHGSGQRCVPTLFLPHHRLDDFVRFVHTFAEHKARGELELIPSLALEGPLLASFGGTPETGNWAPTRSEWLELCRCGPLGLCYMVISPDAIEAGAAAPFARSPLATEEIVGLLLEHSIRPALGHFQRTDAEASAHAVDRIVELAGQWAAPRFPAPLLTDHLFNDTPLRFHHAWRTPEERARRDRELRAARLPEWTLDNVDELAGAVPAALLRAAHAGWAMVCLNFDGEHVDLEICRRVVDLIGSKSIIAMTDGTDASTLGGQALHRTEYNTLHYQGDGIVAAGSASLDRQMSNMRRIGLAEGEIWRMIAFNSDRLLGTAADDAERPPRFATCVDAERRRCPVTS